MPTYELAVLFRQMTRPELIQSVRRTADAIFNKGGIIRKLEKYENEALPYKINAKGLVHKTASTFIIQFDTPPAAIDDLSEEYGRDVDIIRKRIFKVTESEPIECTLHEELLPPAYRKNVQNMIAEGMKQQSSTKFKHNSGLDYYPFQK